MAKQNGTTRSSQSRRPSGSATSSRANADPGGFTGSRGGGSGGGGNRHRRAQAGGSRTRARREQALRQHQQEQQQEQQGSQRGGDRHGAITGARAKVVDTVRENPIPAAIAGAALAYLLIKNRQRLPVPHMPQALTGIAEAARESFNDTAQSTRQAVRGGVGSAAEAVKDSASTLAEYAQNGASKVGHVAKKGYQRGREAVATTWDEHPLTAGIALLAAGVAAGMMLPAPTSGAISRAAKGLTQRVTATSEELLESARELVSSSARNASREAKRQGLTPDQLSRKVKRVANAATP
jgi:hypothetical protein